MKEWLITREEDKAYRTLVEMAPTKTQFDAQVLEEVEEGVRLWVAML